MFAAVGGARPDAAPVGAGSVVDAGSARVGAGAAGSAPAGGRGTVVTGAASGIGRAVALRLAQDGVPLVLVDRDAARLDQVLGQVTAATGAPAIAVVADVSDARQVEDAFAAAQRHLAGVVRGDAPARRGATVELAGLVCAAGILEPGGLEVTRASWDRHLAVNTTGVLHCLQSASARLRDGGAVVVVGSNAARVARTGMLAYAASKAATAALVRCAGLELAGRGIRCNVVEPGSTDTPMQRDLWPDAADGRQRAVAGDAGSFRVGIPLGRLAAAQDVAATVRFLLSDDARHLTLQRIAVDGGASL